MVRTEHPLPEDIGVWGQWRQDHRSHDGQGQRCVVPAGGAFRPEDLQRPHEEAGGVRGREARSYIIELDFILDTLAIKYYPFP